MNVTLASLEALIFKATHESLMYPDLVALEAFCAVMRDSPDGPQLATQALAGRIHSSNPREAMLALTLTDRCMRRGNANFQAEVGKFRFLNEMIKLVSPKYLANRTAPEVKTRVLQLLHAWSLEYPKETKFKVAYDMLKNQGVVKETPPPLPPEEGGPSSHTRVKIAIFEDEEKCKLLQKLLQSKKPEDIQHANRIIKSMVREEERRNEAISRRAQEVSAAIDSASLLNDLLDVMAGNATPDEKQLIDDLYGICMAMRPVLQQLASNTASNLLSDILRAGDVLDEVNKKYIAFDNEYKKIETRVESPESCNSVSLLDFAGSNNEGRGDTPKNDAAKKDTMDELGDIFSTASNHITEPLKPVSLLPNGDPDLPDEKSKAEGWNELDTLGEQLLKQSLPDNAKRVESFNSKSKIPMNALTSPKHELPVSNRAMFDLDFFIKKPEDEPKVTETHTSPMAPNDDVMVDISETPQTNTLNNNEADSILDLGLPDSNAKSEELEKPVNVKDTLKVTKAGEVKPLTDIDVTLQSVTPSKIPPLTAYEEESGVTIVLHFCKDKPRPDVNVIVISTTSKNSSPIEDYKFQSVVPKGCKVRLLTPSGTSLPAYNPFLPPPALTQVMLIARPPSSPAINLKFVITYTSDDDMVSEMGELNQLPLDDI